MTAHLPFFEYLIFGIEITKKIVAIFHKWNICEKKLKVENILFH